MKKISTFWRVILLYLISYLIMSILGFDIWISQTEELLSRYIYLSSVIVIPFLFWKKRLRFLGILIFFALAIALLQGSSDSRQYIEDGEDEGYVIKERAYFSGKFRYIVYESIGGNFLFKRAKVIIAPYGGVSYPSVLLPYVDGNPREHVILDPGYR